MSVFEVIVMTASVAVAAMQGWVYALMKRGARYTWIDCAIVLLAIAMLCLIALGLHLRRQH